MLRPFDDHGRAQLQHGSGRAQRGRRRGGPPPPEGRRPARIQRVARPGRHRNLRRRIAEPAAHIAPPAPSAAGRFAVGGGRQTSSPSCRRVLDRLADGSRTVFVDSPPLRGAPENSIVIANARYVVLTVNKNSSDFTKLLEAIEVINDAGGVLLGVGDHGVSRRRVRRHDDGRTTRRGRRDDDASPSRTSRCRLKPPQLPATDPRSARRARTILRLHRVTGN